MRRPMSASIWAPLRQAIIDRIVPEPKADRVRQFQQPTEVVLAEFVEEEPLNIKTASLLLVVQLALVLAAIAACVVALFTNPPAPVPTLYGAALSFSVAVSVSTMRALRRSFWWAREVTSMATRLASADVAITVRESAYSRDILSLLASTVESLEAVGATSNAWRLRAATAEFTDRLEGRETPTRDPRTWPFDKLDRDS